MSTHIAWPEAQRICDIPEVHEALEAFSHDSTEDNAVALICAALNAAGTFTQGRAAGLELPLWKVDRVDGVIRAVDENGNEIATGLGREVYLFVKAHNAAIRALSPTPSEAGKDDPILATWPAEIWLQAGDEPLGHYSEYEDVTWCRIPQGESDVRYVRASSLEVIGKGENK
ncbi:hypothetical protein [Herbaspirillum sp. CAH-3]|uniref:hypothetical protein n=1 Tax=Herbaspirillum sp. CAH-3 TaxID=2605746 RepID=UPI0012AC6C8E|nr:hypothetical protein [Herbaspirillum sp. CAH-3]MRT30781.1 hypothetical protein [Herbaspirillum sp. CAH-3]